MDDNNPFVSDSDENCPRDAASPLHANLLERFSTESAGPGFESLSRRKKIS
jgi:hypothetical protein